MVKTTGVYQGDKHCELTHLPSASKIETDAPKDNNGRGERFSPTDLVAAALGSCVLTVMAIVAERSGVSITGATFEVEKEMVNEPTRRIKRLTTNVKMPAGIPKEIRAKLEATALHCPVKKSLHPEIEVPLSISYPD